MAIKTADKSVKLFVSKQEEFDKQPTVVCFRPMTKRQNDEYMDSLAEFKRGKFVSKASKSGEFLYQKAVCGDDVSDENYLVGTGSIERERGVLIYNAIIDGTLHKKVTDRTIAIEFLMSVTNIDWATELEGAIRGQSSLDEDEEKNSVGQ